MLRDTVFVLAVATMAVLGDERSPLMLFQPDSKTHMEDVVMQYDSKGQPQERYEQGALAFLAHVDPEWMPKNLFLDHSNIEYSKDLQININVNYGSGDGSQAVKNIPLVLSLDGKYNPKIRTFWWEVLPEAYHQAPFYHNNKDPNIFGSVADCIHRYTTLDPVVKSFNVDNSDGTVNKDEVWKFLNAVKANKNAIIQTKETATKLRPNSAYVVVDYKESDTLPKDPKNYNLTKIDLFDPTTDRGLLSVFGKPKVLDIVRDTRYLVQLPGPLPALPEGKMQCWLQFCE